MLSRSDMTLRTDAGDKVMGSARLKLREPEGVSIPGWPVVPVLFLLSVAGVTAFAVVREPMASFFGVITVVIGLVVWWVQTLMGGGSGVRK